MIIPRYINMHLFCLRSLSNYILLHLFTGPKPKDVIRQLTSHIGSPRYVIQYTMLLFLTKINRPLPSYLNRSLQPRSDRPSQRTLTIGGLSLCGGSPVWLDCTKTIKYVVERLNLNQSNWR